MHLRISLQLNPLLYALMLVSLVSCGTLTDLVLDDPAFKQDMVDAAIAGTRFHITPEDYPEIRKLLLDERLDWRLAGVLLAGQTGDSSFAPLIADAALDEHPDLADRALELMRTEPEHYREAIRSMLGSDEPSIRVGGLKLLALIGGEDEVPLVLVSFGDSDEAVRTQAALTVRTLTDRTNPFLREILEAEDPLVRSAAIRTLGMYAHAGDMPLFVSAFDSEDAALRREAQVAALKVGEAGLEALHNRIADVESGYRGRLSSLDVIQGLRSNESLGLLMSLLGDEDSRIAAKAQSILGTYGPEAIPGLTELYRTSSEEYRSYAVRLLAEINDLSAFPVLAAALDDPVLQVRRRAYDALKAAGDDSYPALRERLQTGKTESLQSSLSLLMDGPDPWLSDAGDGRPNNRSLFLVISMAGRSSIRRYLEAVSASPLVVETVLALKDAWDAGEEFASLQADIDSGNDPYLYTWHQWEQLSVESREILASSFVILHDYFENPDPEILTEARRLRAESRRLEEEARKLKLQLDTMPAATKMQGESRLEEYRESRDFLVRTWEYIIPELMPLAQLVYADRNLDPDALSRESALLD